MIVGNIQNWLVSFAIGIVEIPAYDTLHRKEFMDKQTSLFVESHVEDYILEVKNTSNPVGAEWVEPTVKQIENSEEENIYATWSCPNEVCEIDVSDELIGAKWYDPIVWGDVC